MMKLIYYFGNNNNGLHLLFTLLNDCWLVFHFVSRTLIGCSAHTFIWRLLCRPLIYVSTLDGKLSALTVNSEDGQLLWSVQADGRPLLSSSISQLEVILVLMRKIIGKLKDKNQAFRSCLFIWSSGRSFSFIFSSKTSNQILSGWFLTTVCRGLARVWLEYIILLPL